MNLTKKMLLSVGITSAFLSLSACGSLTPKTTATQYYRIFNIETNAKRSVVVKSASEGLAKNVSSADESNPLFMGQYPKTPSRFKIVDAMKGSGLASFAGASTSAQFKRATCDGAVWIANARRNQNLSITACLFPYQGGYSLNLYGLLVKHSGGLSVGALSGAIAHAAVGSDEEWTEKTFLDVVRKIKADTQGKVKFIEGYPEMQGTPWLDSGKEK